MSHATEQLPAPAPELPEGDFKNLNKGKKVRPRTILAVGAGALTATLLVVGLAVIPKGERGGTVEPTGEETSQTDEPIPSETPVDSGEQTNNGEFTGTVMEQTHSIEEMDAITDINVFAQLPYADRLAYAIDKRADLATTDDQGYGNPSLIPGFYWQNIDGTAMIDGDTLEGAKIISANEYYGTDLSTGQASEAYQASSQSVLDNGGEGVAIANTRVYVANGEWQSGKDRDGNPIDFINITSYNADSHSGERLGSDITDQTIRQQVKLLNGTTVIAYPRGYGIEGQQSPVEGGIY